MTRGAGGAADEAETRAADGLGGQRDFRLPFIPWLKKHKVRGALQIFNITNHSNPRDVYANVSSPHFGSFAGFQHRLYEASLDIVD